MIPDYAWAESWQVFLDLKHPLEESPDKSSLGWQITFEKVVCQPFFSILQTALYLLKPLFIENYKQHFINILNNKNYENIIKNLIRRG